MKSDYSLTGTVNDLSRQIQQGLVTPTAVVEAHLENIEKFDSKLGAFETIFAEEALAAASAATKAIAASHRIGPFHGIPFGLKDICEFEGHVTTNGSMAMRDRVSTYTGTLVRRLVSAGGIVIGKTKAVECAFGGWGTNQHMSTPWNPWDLQQARVPGGSSSGSGVAVAAGLAVCAVGTDTGGSVRLPAGYCGLVGLKVTEGQLPTDGIMPLSQTLDTPGPMTQSVVDALIMYQVMSGVESWQIDIDRAQNKGMFAQLNRGVKGLRLGVLDNQEREICSSEILDNYDATVEQLELLGAEISVFSATRSYGELSHENGSITAVEAYHNHAVYYDDASLPMDEDVRKRMFTGKTILAHNYVGMLHRRQTAIDEFANTMAGFDALLTPTCVSAAPLLSEVDQDQVPGYFTRPFNYLGLCALSLPAGLTKSGLPASLQIVGAANDEAMALRIGAALETAQVPIGRPVLTN
jgi:aspartyl-tRNA(Asn)/glutamyl-tRNA(Gln) amidotransferase subunit A